jgi:hypothetical protein
MREPRGKSNAVLYVEFAPGQPAPRVISIQLERARADLHDDGVAPDDSAGDGIHSGFINVDAGKLRRDQARLPGAKQAIPVFVGREIVARVVTESVDARSMRNLSPVAVLRRLPIIPLRENQEGQRPSKEIRQFTIPVLRGFGPGDFFPLFPFVDPATIDASQTLVITDPNVIGDPTRTFKPCSPTGPVGNPNGKWTFHHLMDEMANTGATGITTDAFVTRWARRWQHLQVINDWPVPARSFVTNAILGSWLSGTTLDWTKTPFQLLAIVNRVDLRENGIYGGTNAGEARFVFGLVDPNTCANQSMTVIFEYGVRKGGCLAIKNWGQQWLNLQSLTPGSGAYKSALEAITIQFTERGTNPSQTPNQNSLNQLRTNEKLGSPDWELREFRLARDDADVGHLREVTTKQTPDLSLNNMTVVADYVNANATLVVQDKHAVPVEFPIGSPFLSGSAVTPFGIFWDGTPPSPSTTITTLNSRFHFSLDTCNGCHAGETRTLFEHIGSGVPVPVSQLSRFMAGDPTSPDGDFHMSPDAAGEPVDRAFNDLKRRRQSLAQLVSQQCFFQIFFDPLRMVH